MGVGKGIVKGTLEEVPPLTLKLALGTVGDIGVEEKKAFQEEKKGERKGKHRNISGTCSGTAPRHTGR